MGKKMGATATASDQAISGASQKKHLRSRKPKFDQVSKPKQGIYKKKKDKKKKRKEVSAARTPKQLDNFSLMFAETRASFRQLKEQRSEINRIAELLDNFSLMFAETRASFRQLEEQISEINADIVNQLNAFDGGDNGF